MNCAVALCSSFLCNIHNLTDNEIKIARLYIHVGAEIVKVFSIEDSMKLHRLMRYVSDQLLYWVGFKEARLKWIKSYKIFKDVDNNSNKKLTLLAPEMLNAMLNDELSETLWWLFWHGPYEWWSNNWEMCHSKVDKSGIRVRANSKCWELSVYTGRVSRPFAFQTPSNIGLWRQLKRIQVSTFVPFYDFLDQKNICFVALLHRGIDLDDDNIFRQGVAKKSEVIEAILSPEMLVFSNQTVCF